VVISDTPTADDLVEAPALAALARTPVVGPAVDRLEFIQ
jgi:hypothetical protein